MVFRSVARILGVGFSIVGLVVGCGGGGRTDDGGLPSGITAQGSASADGSASGTETADDGDDGPDKLDLGGSTGIMEPNDECAELIETADIGAGPADIIWLIDNSDSMFAEAGFVQQNMNAFSAQISAANVDVHVIMISDYPAAGTAGVCVDAPLGSGGCPAADNNPPAFTHVNNWIGSNNALQRVVDHYPDYQDMLRPDALTHVVVVTDDDSDIPAQTFLDNFGALAPHLDDLVFHGIIGMEDPVTACLTGSACCLQSAAEGKVYKDLINQTGGVLGNLCDQEFQPIFDEVAMGVIDGVTLACSFEIPPPPDGEEFDRDKVNVEFLDGAGGTLEIGRVDTAAECAGVTDGWYYDDLNDPQWIHVCPQTCDKIQGFATAQVVIIFGCATIPAG